MPRVRLVDFEMTAVEIFREGLLMAPVAAIPRLLARHSLRTRTSLSGRSTRRSRPRCSATSGVSRTPGTSGRRPAFSHTFGRFPRERVNPNGGSIALGHPFGATGIESSPRPSGSWPPCRRGAGESSACARTAVWARWRCSRGEAAIVVDKQTDLSIDINGYSAGKIVSSFNGVPRSADSRRR